MQRPYRQEESKGRVVKPLLALALVVKNEAKSLPALIASLRPHVDVLTLFDTGSTDGTLNIAFREHVADILIGEFGDYARARNTTLRLAHREARFALVMSGDETLEGGEALRAWCEKHRDSDAPCAHVLIDYQPSREIYIQPRVVRDTSGWEYVGRVHEMLLPPPSWSWEGKSPIETIPGVTIRYSGEVQKAGAHERWVAYLREDLADARTPRTLYYLATSLDALGRAAEAEPLWEERLRTPSNSAQDFLALMGAGAHFETKGGSRRAAILFTAATRRFPDRAEPFLRLAKLDLAEGAFLSAKVQALRGLALPLPNLESGLGVDAAVYQYKLAEVVAFAAFQLGDYATSETAIHRALEEAPAGPDREKLESNLKLLVGMRGAASL